jgi:hypothetical protein
LLHRELVQAIAQDGRRRQVKLAGHNAANG